MKNSTLSLSLLIGAALTMPILAMAAQADTTAADEQAVAVETTINDTDASEFGTFTISETQIISRVRVDSTIAQQPMTTEIKAPQEALQDSELQTTEIISEGSVLEDEEELLEADLEAENSEEGGL